LFGTGGDLEIFHSGTDSIINDAGGGNLVIQLAGGGKMEFTAAGADFTGALTATGNITANGFIGDDFNSTSDQRFKSNIKVIDNAVDKVSKLNGVYFDWIANGEKSMGVIAQQIEETVPEVVFTDNKGFKSVSYGKLVGLLIEAIKEQQILINNLSNDK